MPQIGNAPAVFVGLEALFFVIENLQVGLSSSNVISILTDKHVTSKSIRYTDN